MHRFEDFEDPKVRVVNLGPAIERYKGALATVLEEIALIRADRGVGEVGHHTESQKFSIDGTPSKVTLTSSSVDFWTVEVLPHGAQAALKYEYGPDFKGVMLHLPSGDQTINRIRIPKDETGAGMLGGLRAILFDLHEAGA